MAKELCMVENNETGRQIRRYFIEVEKRYRQIINNQTNIFDFMRLALDQIESNSKNIDVLNLKVEDIQSKIDVTIKSNYCLASDIAEQLNLYSENKIPHSNIIGAIARQLGYKISYKHYYEDEYIAIIKDLSKNEYWQVYFKPLAVEEIKKWFNTSGSKYKELNLKEKLITMPDDEKIKLLASNGMLIKRPVLISNNGVYVGFKQVKWEEILNTK